LSAVSAHYPHGQPFLFSASTCIVIHLRIPPSL
jgi:hypothetical protein